MNIRETILKEIDRNCNRVASLNNEIKAWTVVNVDAYQALMDEFTAVADELKASGLVTWTYVHLSMTGTPTIVLSADIDKSRFNEVVDVVTELDQYSGRFSNSFELAGIPVRFRIEAPVPQEDVDFLESLGKVKTITETRKVMTCSI
jgi:hypothetical protein